MKVFLIGDQSIEMQKLYCKHLQNDYYTIVRIVHQQLHPCEDWALNESGFTIYLDITMTDFTFDVVQRIKCINKSLKTPIFVLERIEHMM